MWPRLPELVVIAIICLNTLALLKLDDLGESAWRLRVWLDPSLEPTGDAGEPE